MPEAGGQIAALRQRWRSDGILRRRNVFGPAEVAKLRAVCDRVLALWRGPGPVDRSIINMAYLTEPRYHAQRPDDLVTLLELIAAPAVLDLLGIASDAPPLFHNTQYFFETASRSFAGDWHRDTQFLAPDPALERQRILTTTGVHVRVAFLDDDRLEVIPGSHRRWDTAEELAVRRAGDPVLRRAALPGARRIDLAAGDLCMFHAWSLHRGHYGPLPARRTLDIIYMLDGACDFAPPPPTCFTDPALTARLSPAARAMARRFAAAYGGHWQSSSGLLGSNP